MLVSSQVEVARKTLEVTKETLDLTRQRFDAGVTDNVEVVQAEEICRTFLGTSFGTSAVTAGIRNPRPTPARNAAK